MKKDFYEMQKEKLLIRSRILIRSFWLNTLFVLLVWLLSFIPGFLFMGALITGVPGAWFFYLMMCGLALWEMVAIIFFLVPGISAYIESRRIRE